MKKRQRVRRGIIISSFFLFPVTIFYFSPVLIIMGAAQGVVAGSAVSFVILFIVSLVLGRSFCGWICPAGGLTEICQLITVKPVKKRYWLKYVIWVPWLGAIIYLFITAGFSKIDPWFRMGTFISIDNPYAYIVYYFFLALIVVLSFVVGKRSFCHHICWMAPFMVIGRTVRNSIKWPSLHLVSDRDLCVKCGLCDSHCQMSLPVSDMVAADAMEHSECILCGMCVDVCNKGSIGFAFFHKQKKQ